VDGAADPAAEAVVAPPDVGDGGVFHGATGIDEFNFAQFRSSFEEVSLIYLVTFIN
jgi:hypothetical protein